MTDAEPLFIYARKELICKNNPNPIAQHIFVWPSVRVSIENCTFTNLHLYSDVDFCKYGNLFLSIRDLCKEMDQIQPFIYTEVNPAFANLPVFNLLGQMYIARNGVSFAAGEVISALYTTEFSCSAGSVIKAPLILLAQQDKITNVGCTFAGDVHYASESGFCERWGSYDFVQEYCALQKAVELPEHDDL